MAKKLNAFEIKLLLEYRQYQDIKNLADKKCKQLQKQVYQLIDDKKLCEKENYIFSHNRNVFSIAEVNRSLTDMIVINPHMHIWGGQNIEEVN